MKLSLLFFAIGILLVFLQTTFLHLLPLGPIVPDLTLLLCVYWGLHHPTVGAVLGTFMLGYSVDAVSSPILGLNAFAMSLVFLSVYISSRTVWIQNPVVSTVVVFFASWVKGVALVLVWAIFLNVEDVWMGALKYILLEAIIAAALAPIVFSWLRRGQTYMEAARVPA